MKQYVLIIAMVSFGSVAGMHSRNPQKIAIWQDTSEWFKLSTRGIRLPRVYKQYVLSKSLEGTMAGEDQTKYLENLLKSVPMDQLNESNRQAIEEIKRGCTFGSPEWRRAMNASLWVSQSERMLLESQYKSKHATSKVKEHELTQHQKDVLKKMR